MAEVICEQVSKGLRDSEAIVCLNDVHDRRHFIRVECDFLRAENGRHYLPIAIVYVDPRSKAVLVELPHEAETGVNRIWMRESAFHQPLEASA